MKDFSTIDYVTGSFPNVVAADSSGPTVRDGTPMTADWVNELFGSFQAMLEYTGISASGTTESASGGDTSFSGSQIIEAIRRMAALPGEVVYFAGRDPDPIAHTGRLLQLAGQTISIADYPDLAASVYCGDANNATAIRFYKSTSDINPATSRSTSGTYLTLPDCRGYFLRSLDGSNPYPIDYNRDAAGNTDEPGSVQGYQAGTHDHPVGYDLLGTGTINKIVLDSKYLCTTNPGVGTPQITFRFEQDTDPIVNGSDEGIVKTTTGGYDYATPSDLQTRPLNVAFYAMIRY